MNPPVSHKILGMLIVSGVALSLLIASVASADEWSVQIGAFRTAPVDYATAAEEVGPLSTSQNATGITRFQIGRYDSRDAAKSALAALVQAGYADAFIVKKNATDRMTSTTRSEVTTASVARRTSEASGSLAGVPESIRSRVVILDGAYHVKDGERFTPLDEALRALR